MNKYNKNNWEIWKNIIKQSDDKFIDNPCSYCQFAMPNNSTVVCAATHYGLDSAEIAPSMKIYCDFAIDINTYIMIGESGMYEDFGHYIESIF